MDYPSKIVDKSQIWSQLHLNIMIQVMTYWSRVSPYQVVKMFFKLKTNCSLVEQLHRAPTQLNFIAQLELF